MSVPHRDSPAAPFRQRVTPQMSLVLGVLTLLLAPLLAGMNNLSGSLGSFSPFVAIGCAAVGGAHLMRYFLLKDRGNAR